MITRSFLHESILYWTMEEPYLIPFKYTSSHYSLNTWAVELSSFVNKTHGCDDISFCIIKLCDQWIVKPLSVIYWNCLNTYIFKGISNIVPVCKKVDKKVINNYQPASLMMVCGKILERLVFNLIFDFLDNSSLLLTHVKASFCQFVMKYIPLFLLNNS